MRRIYGPLLLILGLIIPAAAGNVHGGSYSPDFMQHLDEQDRMENQNRARNVDLEDGRGKGLKPKKPKTGSFSANTGSTSQLFRNPVSNVSYLMHLNTVVSIRDKVVCLFFVPLLILGAVPSIPIRQTGKWVRRLEC